MFQLLFFFFPFQATHCRAIFPCQDTPSVKLTYYAEVKISKSLRGLKISTMGDFFGFVF